MNKKVSIIVPVYNVEMYLERCVKSLVNQTYLNTEIILVDDGSQDDSGSLCDNYAMNYPNVFAYHKANGGLSDARNYGLNKITGDLIAFVDSDDWINVDMIEKLVVVLEQYEADIACCEYFVSDGRRIYEKKLSGEVTCKQTKEALQVLVQNKMYKSHAWNKLFTAKLLENESFPTGRYYEDIFVMHNWFKKAKKVVFVEEALYYYFERPNSIVHTAKIEIVDDMISANTKRLKDIEKWGEYDADLREYAEAGVLSATLLAYSRLPKNKNIKNIRRKYLRTIKSYGFKYCKYLDRKLLIDFLVLKDIRIFYGVWLYFRRKSQIINGGKRIVHLFKSKASSYSFEPDFNKKEKKVVLMGSPEYRNLGDIAIAYATKVYFQQVFPDIQYVEISEKSISLYMKEIKKRISNDDLLLLQGGGNLNDLYRDQNELRSLILRKFPNNRIIMMPQSCFFDRTTRKGRIAYKQIYRDFKQHKSLTLFARDPLSEIRMKEYFDNDVNLIPDIVLFLEEIVNSQERKHIGICLRRDSESNLELDEYIDIVYNIRQISNDIAFLSTLASHDIPVATRMEELEHIWSQFSSCSVVITDRLHGVIFCYITKTPCIAIDTNNEKIAGILHWMKNVSYIRVCNDLKLINDTIVDLLENNDDYTQVNMRKSFEPLEKTVEKWKEYIGG